MPARKQFDVVVVGASVAGSATAILYARQGLKVALLERGSKADQYKQVCTHFIQPAAIPTIRKLGLDKQIEAAGGLRNELEVWTRWGWIRASDPGAVGYGYNIRRQTLDPILRDTAAGTGGVCFFPATSANALLGDRGGRAAGVVANRHGETIQFVAPLVVAADGGHSRLAQLAGLKTRQRRNDRFTFYTYFRGLPLRSRANSQYWHLHPNLAYAFRNDDDTTLLGIFLPRRRLKEFQQDPLGNFCRFWRDAPDAPDITTAEPICPLRGITKIPNQWRPAAAPGIALVGDAAMVLDPIWGTGCSFAFLSADWLVQQTAPCLAAARRTTDAVDRGLRQYRRLHRARLRGHFWHIASFSKLREPNLLERLLFAAATRDPQVADRVLTYFGRTVGPAHLASPAGLCRAVLVNLGLISRENTRGCAEARSSVPVA